MLVYFYLILLFQPQGRPITGLLSFSLCKVTKLSSIGILSNDKKIIWLNAKYEMEP